MDRNVHGINLESVTGCFWWMSNKTYISVFYIDEVCSYQRHGMGTMRMFICISMYRVIFRMKRTDNILYDDFNHMK